MYCYFLLYESTHFGGLLQGEVNEAAGARVVCGRLLGAMCPKLERRFVETFYSKAMDMCQDTDCEVCPGLTVIS